MCAKNYSDKKFAILFGRSSFRLSAAKALYINLCKPNLCRQKEFMYNSTFCAITRFDAFFKHPNHLRSALLNNQLNFSFLYSDVYIRTSVRQKVKMYFLLAIFKFCTQATCLKLFVEQNYLQCISIFFVYNGTRYQKISTFLFIMAENK